MKTIIRFEEIAIFFLTIYLFSELNYVWWLFPVLLFLPDISMIGYTINNKVGAIIYNVAHHRGISIFTYLVGLITSIKVIALIGIILLAHSTFDRIFNYGLKYFKGFKFTSLGEI